MADWKLSCETRGDIPLPLDLVFGDVLNMLDPKTNSFFILQHDNGNFIQCGGSKATCTVEFRISDTPRKYQHYVVGHAGGSAQAARVPMSAGVVTVQKGEVLNIAEAAELFNLFFAGRKFPMKYVLRQTDI